MSSLDTLERALRKDKIVSCVVYKGESVIFEYYKNRKAKEKPFKINSVTKSITSALLGIAIEQGYIENEDVFDWSLFRRHG
ncbi:hypothetical protein ACFSVM_12155 [Paenibacillus shunpengii]|uniref:Beta-lactamase n=1 Tax=Paenibacillus shunpengii TaxID=2054424 RepID=A0ABW5SP93_9BACL